MLTKARPVKNLALALGVALVWSLLAGVVAGGEGVRVGSITVYPPEETRGFCRVGGDATWLEFPGCRTWALAPDESLYVPMPLGAVVEAVEEIKFPLDGLPIEIVILPVPRLDLPESSAEGPVVLLAPARYGYPQEHIHYIVAHEVGHVIHHLLLPNPYDDLWRQYACLRGVDFEAARRARRHADRLEEIFAEDFRILFGGNQARCGGAVENHDLADPETVPGLRDFFLSIRRAWENRLRLYAYPNPFCERLQVEAFTLGDAVRVDLVVIYDALGRLVKVMGPEATTADQIIWDGRLEGGMVAAPGVYYAYIAAGASTAAVKVVKVSR